MIFTHKTIDSLVNALKPYSSDDALSKLYQWPIDAALLKLKGNKNTVWAEEIISSTDNVFNKTLKLRERMQETLNNLKPGSPSYIESIKWIVNVWGRVRDGGAKTLEASDEKPEGLVNIVNQAEINHKNNKEFKFNRIASWSKFIAFKHPNERAIYDARVIFSLNWMLFCIDNEGDFKYFPAPSTQNTLMLQFDYSNLILLKKAGPQMVCKEIISDIERRNARPGAKSSAIQKLKSNIYIQNKFAYSTYCKLLHAIAEELYADTNSQHALTKVEMILFTIADRCIILEVIGALSQQNILTECHQGL